MKKMNMKENYEYVKTNIRSYYKEGRIEDVEHYSFSDWFDYHSKKAQTAFSKMLAADISRLEFKINHGFGSEELNKIEESVLKVMQTSISTMSII